MPIWYWERHDLNRYADRLRWYDRAALALLDRDPGNIRGFQRAAGIAVDGVSGPNTRAAMHKALKLLPPLVAGVQADVPPDPESTAPAAPEPAAMTAAEKLDAIRQILAA